MIDGVVEFLSGNDRPIRAELAAQMREASAEERFEDAARYRNRLHAVERLAERQAVERASIGTIDVIGLAVGPQRAAVQVFPLRGGRMVDRYSFHLDNAAGAEPLEVLEGFCIEYYGTAPSLPPQVLVPRGLGDLTTLAALPLASCAARGSRCARPSGARSGGCRSSPSRTPSSRSPRRRSSPRAAGCARVEALEELREVLNLESLPLRIECFDISNIQGQEIVGSMVVFEDGVARKAHYRKFAMRGQEGQDDFAAMAELVGAALRAARPRTARRATTSRSRRRRTSSSSTAARGSSSAALAAMDEPTTCRVSR